MLVRLLKGGGGQAERSERTVTGDCRVTGDIGSTCDEIAMKLAS